MWDLLAVGEVLLDVSAPEFAAGLSAHAPVRVAAGGSPVLAARAAAELGASAAVAGRIGDDDAGSAIRAALVRAGIEPLLAVDGERATGTFVEAGSGAARGVVTDRGASAALGAADLPAALTAGAVLVSGFALLHDDTAPAAVAAIARAEARWIAVGAGSAALAGRRGAEAFHALARGANVLLANAAEAAALTGLDPEAAALALAERYGLACVTDGPAGAVAAVAGGRIARAAPPEPVARVRAGAGDAFAGALLASLARGAALDETLQIACAAGARAAGGRAPRSPGPPDALELPA